MGTSSNCTSQKAQNSFSTLLAIFTIFLLNGHKMTIPLESDDQLGWPCLWGFATYSNCIHPYSPLQLPQIHHSSILSPPSILGLLFGNLLEVPVLQMSRSSGFQSFWPLPLGLSCRVVLQMYLLVDLGTPPLVVLCSLANCSLLWCSLSAVQRRFLMRVRATLLHGCHDKYLVCS